jgi:hypothetical protein
LGGLIVSAWSARSNIFPASTDVSLAAAGGRAERIFDEEGAGLRVLYAVQHEGQRHSTPVCPEPCVRTTRHPCLAMSV